MYPIICNGIAIYRNAIRKPNELIGVVESVISNDLNNSICWEKSSVVHSDGTTGVSEVRTNSILHLQTMEKDIFSVALNHVNKILHESFSSCLSNFSRKFKVNVNSRTSSNYSILKYENGEKYIHHLDDGPQTPRKVSAVGYLNDDFSGGELDFDKLDFRYSPVAGDIVVFPSMAPYSHASLPIASGIKYSVVNWWS